MGVLYLQNSCVYVPFCLLVLMYCQLLNIIAFSLVCFPCDHFGVYCSVKMLSQEDQVT